MKVNIPLEKETKLNSEFYRKRIYNLVNQLQKSIDIEWSYFV